MELNVIKTYAKSPNCHLQSLSLYTKITLAITLDIHYLNCGDDFMGVYICQIHKIVYFKYIQFIICQLCLKKAVS